jgi:alkylhydroperoxidase family enzyme
MTDYKTAPIGEDMKQLLSFAEKVARDAGHVSRDDIEKVRSAGFSDRAILDAAHVAGFFSYMNRVVLALGADAKIRTSAVEIPLPDISARVAQTQT